MIPMNRIGLLETKKTLGSWWISIQDEETKELMFPQIYEFCYIIYTSAVKKALFYGNYDSNVKILHHWLLLSAHPRIKTEEVSLLAEQNSENS